MKEKISKQEENIINFLVVLVFILGLIMIVKGGDLFVDGAIWIAERTGISPAIIGATIVSLATTLPELFVSTLATKQGLAEMAIGNALGSYICNIAFIIGICAIIKPIKIGKGLFGLKGILMIGYLGVFYIFATDGVISYKEGFILLALMIVFMGLNIYEYKRQVNNNKKSRQVPKNGRELSLNIIKFILGGILIIIGAHLLVDSGVEIAQALKVPTAVISLTLIALGTSLPELVTALSSIIKKEQGISIGNVLGANILNISLIIGVSALVSNNGLTVTQQTLTLDIPMGMIVALIFVGIGVLRKGISRFTGVVLVSVYLSYLFILF